MVVTLTGLGVGGRGTDGGEKSESKGAAASSGRRVRARAHSSVCKPAYIPCSRGIGLYVSVSYYK